MSFTDSLKRSLGFEENESSSDRDTNMTINNITEMFKNITKPTNNGAKQQKQDQYPPRPSPAQNQTPPRPTPVYEEDYDDFVITPEQPFYEIVLIRPKTIDDINYVVDQVIEEKNPVIVDLSFLEKESPANFKLAGEKIKQMRSIYESQALLLSRTEEKNLIIISPKKVKVVNKG